MSLRLLTVCKHLLLFTFILFIAAGCKKNHVDRYEELRKNVPDPYKAFVNPFGDGTTIGGAVHVANDIIILFNEPGTKYAWYQDNRVQGVFGVRDPDGPIGISKLDKIGGAMEYRQGSDYFILMFDMEGKKFQALYYIINQFSPSATEIPSDSIGVYVTSGSMNYLFDINTTLFNNSPFLATGFEAAVKYVKPFNSAEAWHIFEKGGTRYARYEYNGDWGPITSFTAWGGNNNLFSAVGAAALITLNGVNYNIYISKDGSQMGEWHLEGNTSTFEGPWTIN